MNYSFNCVIFNAISQDPVDGDKRNQNLIRKTLDGNWFLVFRIGHKHLFSFSNRKKHVPNNNAVQWSYSMNFEWVPSRKRIFFATVAKLCYGFFATVCAFFKKHAFGQKEDKSKVSEFRNKFTHSIRETRQLSCYLREFLLL